jgi:hypothetical protein
VRSVPDGPLDAVLVLSTEGAPERRRRRRRRPREVDAAEPEPVPTSRATVVRPEPFDTSDEAVAWLAALRADPDALEAEVEAGARVVNRALRAQRAASADPYVREVAAHHALAVRVGYGSGDEVADGRFGAALELPGEGVRRAKRSMEAPDERYAAILGAREPALAGEELVLRARADLNAGRSREAALEARVALEALLAELASEPASGLAEHRQPIGEAANMALRGPLGPSVEEDVEAAVSAMEGALRRHRLGAPPERPAAPRPRRR